MTAVRIDRLQLRDLRIPFRLAFRHASAERRDTSGILVEAAAGAHAGYGEACPRPYVTSETIESARRFFDAHEASLRGAVSDLPSLRSWMASHAEAIDRNPAAWCAIELALLDLLGRSAGVTVDALLSRPPLTGPFRYSAVLGDAGDEAFTAMAQAYAQTGFSDYKVKLSGDLARDRRKMSVLESLGLPDLGVRVDANNLWTDADVAIAHLRALGVPLVGVEEPIGAGRFDDLARIGAALDCRIVLDESFVSADHFRCIEQTPERWAINVRVSKMGGLLRALAIVSDARARGVPVIVGAQVGETSLLTRAALTVAQAAGPDLLFQEGAFGTRLLEYDVCTPCLMFGARGVLDPSAYPALAAPGLGLSVTW